MSKILNKNIQKIQAHASNLIPGLSGLLGKRPEMYLPGESGLHIIKKQKVLKYGTLKIENSLISQCMEWVLVL